MTAEAQDLDSGETLLITADYLIGCDGPASEIRRQIGARLTGDAVISRTQSTYIRAPSLISRMQATPAWSTQSLNPRRSANMFAVDGRETWLIHNYLRPDETDFAAVDRDRCIRLILGVGPEFEYEVLTPGGLDRPAHAGRPFPRRARVHLRRCGAYLGAVRRLRHERRHRRCDEPVLDAGRRAAGLGRTERSSMRYEAERRPITEQVSHYAMNTAMSVARSRAEVPVNIEDPGPEGDAVRETLGSGVGTSCTRRSSAAAD